MDRPTLRKEKCTWNLGSRGKLVQERSERRNMVLLSESLSLRDEEGE
jgi:hypothetical protein